MSNLSVLGGQQHNIAGVKEVASTSVRHSNSKASQLPVVAAYPLQTFSQAYQFLKAEAITHAGESPFEAKNMSAFKQLATNTHPRVGEQAITRSLSLATIAQMCKISPDIVGADGRIDRAKLEAHLCVLLPLNHDERQCILDQAKDASITQANGSSTIHLGKYQLGVSQSEPPADNKECQQLARENARIRDLMLIDAGSPLETEVRGLLNKISPEPNASPSEASQSDPLAYLKKTVAADDANRGAKADRQSQGKSETAKRLCVMMNAKHDKGEPLYTNGDLNAFVTVLSHPSIVAKLDPEDWAKLGDARPINAWHAGSTFHVGAIRGRLQEAQKVAQAYFNGLMGHMDKHDGALCNIPSVAQGAVVADKALPSRIDAEEAAQNAAQRYLEVFDQLPICALPEHGVERGSLYDVRSNPDYLEVQPEWIEARDDYNSLLEQQAASITKELAPIYEQYADGIRPDALVQAYFKSLQAHVDTPEMDEATPSHTDLAARRRFVGQLAEAVTRNLVEPLNDNSSKNVLCGQAYGYPRVITDSRLLDEKKAGEPELYQSHVAAMKAVVEAHNAKDENKDKQVIYLPLHVPTTAQARTVHLGDRPFRLVAPGAKSMRHQSLSDEGLSSNEQSQQIHEVNASKIARYYAGEEPKDLAKRQVLLEINDHLKEMLRPPMTAKKELLKEVYQSLLSDALPGNADIVGCKSAKDRTTAERAAMEALKAVIKQAMDKQEAAIMAEKSASSSSAVTSEDQFASDQFALTGLMERLGLGDPHKLESKGMTVEQIALFRANFDHALLNVGNDFNTGIQTNINSHTVFEVLQDFLLDRPYEKHRVGS